MIANHGVAGGNSWGTDDRFDTVMDINLKGTYNLIGACIDSLKKSTHSYKHILVTSSVLAKMGVDFDKALEVQMKDVPLGKMSDTDELADLFYFLASPSNRSITGQSHDINNGALLF